MARATSADMYRIQRYFKALFEALETAVENYDNYKKALLAKAIEVSPPEYKDILCEPNQRGNPPDTCQWETMFILMAKDNLTFEEALEVIA